MIPAFLNSIARQSESAEQTLRDAGSFDIRKLPPLEITKAVREVVAAGATRVAAVGGDGTVAAVATAIAGTPVEMVVIPAGTLNHFARDHGVPAKLEDACAAASSMRVIRADVGWVNDRLFLSTSSVGVYANFVRIRELHERRFGYWLSSVYAMARTFVRVRPFGLWFETGSTQSPYVTPLAFIAVGERELKLPALGRRVPHGRSGLHVMIVTGRRRARLVALAFAAASRGVSAMSRTPHLDAFVVDRCTIEQRHSTVAVDGEVVTLRSPLEYRVDRGALRVVVP